MGTGDFHRFGDEYLRQNEWRNAPEAARRVALALGPEPIEDARHLLPLVPLPLSAPPLPPGPVAATEFIIDLLGAFPVAADTVRQTFAPHRMGGLGFAQVWGRQRGSRPDAWTPLYENEEAASFTGVALSWELSGLLTEGTEAIQELAGYVVRVQERVAPLGLFAEPRETPEVAARRSFRLISLKSRFARSIEMRLMPQGRAFPSRAVWRTAYSLDFAWGDLDLFHWPAPDVGRPLFRLNALGEPGYFIPERAAEGEGTPGIALSFELPFSPAPLAAYDRMSVALSYFRQKLGGRPLTADGAELDGDRLYDDRDTLQDVIQEMSRAGLAPGSPEAARFF